MAIGHHNALNGSENNINWPDPRSLFNQTFNSLRCFAYKITEWWEVIVKIRGAEQNTQVLPPSTQCWHRRRRTLAEVSLRRIRRKKRKPPKPTKTDTLVTHIWRERDIGTLNMIVIHGCLARLGNTTIGVSNTHTQLLTISMCEKRKSADQRGFTAAGNLCEERETSAPRMVSYPARVHRVEFHIYALIPYGLCVIYYSAAENCAPHTHNWCETRRVVGVFFFFYIPSLVIQ